MEVRSGHAHYQRARDMGHFMATYLLCGESSIMFDYVFNAVRIKAKPHSEGICPPTT